MRILILGGDGMLGHQLFKYLRARHDVRVTLRKSLAEYKKFQLFSENNSYADIDMRNIGDLSGAVDHFKPEAVVNAVGVIKQRSEAKEVIPSIEINALLPHRLVEICGPVRARLIQMSTDCVFSGKKGGYTESDPSDADDLYGKSKYLGEVHGENCFTIRSSIIGSELARKKSLLEWFLAQKGTVKGFKNAIFSGFTTIEMSRIIEMLLGRFKEASGLYHVASDPISKYDLLRLIKKALGLSIEIIPDEEFKCDRGLDSTKFRKTFGYRPPGWEAMIKELATNISEAKQ